MILLLYEHVRVPVVVFFLFVRVCAARNKHASGTVCNVVFVFFGGVLLGPIAGAAVSIPFSASLKMCIVCVQAYRRCSAQFRLVFHRDICAEDSLIRRSNCLTTEQ